MKLSELSKSERRLMGVMAGLVTLLLNVAVLKYFLSTRTQLVQQRAQKTEICESLRLLTQNSVLWEDRAQWVQKRQPKLEGEQAEGNALLNLLKNSASKHGVTLSKQQLVPAKTDSGSIAVPVECELRANWKSMCSFLSEIQSPDRFIVIQQSRLRIDPTDATQMLCNITVAKWFASR